MVAGSSTLVRAPCFILSKCAVFTFKLDTVLHTEALERRRIYSIMITAIIIPDLVSQYGGKFRGTLMNMASPKHDDILWAFQSHTPKGSIQLFASWIW